MINNVNIEKLKFDERGLSPAIVVDSVSKKVLTLAYMSRESLAISIEKQLGIFVWLISGFSILLLDGYVCPSANTTQP